MAFKLSITSGFEHTFIKAKTFASVGGWNSEITNLNDVMNHNGRSQRLDVFLIEGYTVTGYTYSGQTVAVNKHAPDFQFGSNGYWYSTIADSVTDILINVVQDEIEEVPEPVITTETETVTEPIPFETQNQDNPDLEQGQSNVIQQGVNGVRTIVYEVTLSDGVETNRVETSNTITTEPIPKIVEIGTKIPVVMGYLMVNGSNATITLTSASEDVFNGLPNELMTVPVGDYTLRINANTGFYINGFSFPNRYGQPVAIEIPENAKFVERAVTIGNRQDFDFTTDVFEEDEETPVPEPDFAGFNHLYLMDSVAMSSLANDRFTAPDGNPGGSIDLGVNIINILELPFPLNPDFIRSEKNIVLGISTLDTIGQELKADRYVIDFGEIQIPNKYNNSYDFLNTEIKLHLPFVDTIILPIEYVMGQTIRIKYSIDLYSGDTDINIGTSKMNGKIFMSQQTKIGRNIPFVRKDGNSVVTSSNQNGLNNGVYSPFIEVIRNKPYNAGNKFNTPVPVETTLSELTGFIRVDDIDLKSTATLEEQAQIKSILRNGVVINE